MDTVRRDDPWRADEMEKAADVLKWNDKDAKGAPKPTGNFDSDYATLCRIFQVPEHPCLVSRRLTKGSNEATIPKASSEQHIRFQNFIVDLTTLRIMMEALKRSTDVDTLSFHNAGLSDATVDSLVEGLPHTTVRCLCLDYNQPLTLPFSTQHASNGSEGGSLDEEDGNNPSASTLSSRNLPGLVCEASKLRQLQLRGNGIDDAEAVALAEAIEGNDVLCSLNLFGNKISDVGAAAFAKSLRLNSVLRALSLANNRLTSASAEAFGLLLAGGYEVLPAELEKRAEVEAIITAQNKAAAQEKKKKKPLINAETRLPLSIVTWDSDKRAIAGGSKSLAALNLSENPELGAGGALVKLLEKIAEARNSDEEEGKSGQDGTPGEAVALQELHVARCRVFAEDDEGQTASVAAAADALKPTVVTL